MAPAPDIRFRRSSYAVFSMINFVQCQFSLSVCASLLVYRLTVSVDMFNNSIILPQFTALTVAVGFLCVSYSLSPKLSTTTFTQIIESAMNVTAALAIFSDDQ